jgi:hypothetical protein
MWTVIQRIHDSGFSRQAPDQFQMNYQQFFFTQQPTGDTRLIGYHDDVEAQLQHPKCLNNSWQNAELLWPSEKMDIFYYHAITIEKYRGRRCRLA